MKRIELNLLFKLSYLNSNFALALGYLNPASNNLAQECFFHAGGGGGGQGEGGGGRGCDFFLLVCFLYFYYLIPGLND